MSVFFKTSLPSYCVSFVQGKKATPENDMKKKIKK